MELSRPLAVEQLFLPRADLCFSRREGVAPSWWCHAHFQGAKLKLTSRAFCWCIVCFCTINGFFRKLEKARGFLFLKFHNFYEIAEIIFFKIFPPAFYNILKEPLLLQKLTIHQQKPLNFSFNLAPWKWVWHYQEGATPSRREKHRCAWGKKSCSTARGRDSSMVMPHPLLGWQIKAEIKGFLLRYRLLQYKGCFFPIFELKDFLEYTFTPCMLYMGVNWQFRMECFMPKWKLCIWKSNIQVHLNTQESSTLLVTVHSKFFFIINVLI